MKKYFSMFVILLLLMPLVFCNENSDVEVGIGIEHYADVRVSDSQNSTPRVDEPDYDETGHGDPYADVRVESFMTVSSKSGDWYLKDQFAFGWSLYGGTWTEYQLDPQKISQGIYDSTGAKPTMRDDEGDGDYLFVGNHTRFHIATNYYPSVTFAAPSHLVNGSSSIEVKQIQIGYSTSRYGVIAGGSTGNISPYCHPGNYSANEYGVDAVIEVPEAWWTLQSGEYIGTITLTLSDESVPGTP